jgi:hypothetical protein
MRNSALRNAAMSGRALRPVPGMHAFAPAYHLFLVGPRGPVSAGRYSPALRPSAMASGPVFIGSFRSAWAFTPQTEPHQLPCSKAAPWSDRRAGARKWFSPAAPTGPRPAEATEDHQPCPNRSRSWYGRNAAQLRRVSSPIAGRCPHVAVLPYHPRTIKLRLTGRQTSTTRRCRPCTARSRTWQVIRAASAARADVIRDEPILVTLG